MHIHREQLQEFERSIKEMARYAEGYARTLPPDDRIRREIETCLARATEVLTDIRVMTQDRE